MIDLRFPKLYRYDRKGEHSFIALPFSQGEFTDDNMLAIYDGEKALPVQTKVTSRYEDGSVRYLFARFMADLPGNQGKILKAEVIRKAADTACERQKNTENPARLEITRQQDGITVNAGEGAVCFKLQNGSDTLIREVITENKTYPADLFEGPYLIVKSQDGTGEDTRFGIRMGDWKTLEEGPLVAVLRGKGAFVPEGETDITYTEILGEKFPVTSNGKHLPSFECKLTAYAGKPWFEVAFRIINSTPEPIKVDSLVFAIKANADAVFDPVLKGNTLDRGDSVGEGSVKKSGNGFDPAAPYSTNGIKELPELDKSVSKAGGRTLVGSSNYKTNFTMAQGLPVERIVDAKYLMGEANEHFGEVFYGTFFADYTDETGGVCATVYQAQQNFPKAVKSDASGSYVYLVPEGVGNVVMQPGMSREQRFLLHFHSADEPLLEIDNRSLIYQMPDRPKVSPEVFAKAGVMPEIFVDQKSMNPEVEISLIAKCDAHTRSYGMLNFGDGPDPNYTKQGRGKGNLVWTNNEYDFPHACALQYARTGERRFMDYLIASANHWMDVDVCHFSEDPLLLGGQWEHTRGHVVDGVMVCSHEWVEGLLDLYHLTGDERALETALGIGENIRRLLDTPMYQVSGESNARETGWALRSLTALYVETRDRKWVEKAEWIVSQFEAWSEKYGGWIAPYTDNTLIRVGFMISVAVGSLMRYYRVFPTEKLKKLILGAIDDLKENCLLENGLFYYKELPSLNRLGNNTLLVEAMTIGYELTGDTEYLKAGLATFWSGIRNAAGPVVGEKEIVEDAVLVKSGPPKTFAQSFIPLAVFYKAAAEAGLL